MLCRRRPPCITGGGELSSDVIGRSHHEMELTHFRPKIDELVDVLSGDAFSHVDVGDSKLVCDSLIDGQVFPSGDGEDGTGH